MSDKEENMNGLQEAPDSENVREFRSAETGGPTDEEGDAGTEIRDTDIVFDCPHCGHSLAIDYRGAGLQINCVNCGELVLVPIPDGMKIDDLDIEPGEILKQLFASRRMLQKAEARVIELEQTVERLTAATLSLERDQAATLSHRPELIKLCQNGQRLQNEVIAILGRVIENLKKEQEPDTAAKEQAGE